MGNVIQIQKSNAIAISKTSSINVNNVKSTKANQQQTIKLVNQSVGGAGGPTNQTQATTIKHGTASIVKTITSTAMSTMSHPTTIQPKTQTKTPYSIQNAKGIHQPMIGAATIVPAPSKSQLSSVHSNISTHSR